MVPPAILIVEDDGLIALQLHEFIRRTGFVAPIPLASGEEAIEFFKKEPHPDLVLMDITLAGEMDGIETLRRIREISRVPVFFLSAHTDQKTRARAGEVAPVGFIEKPFIESEMLLQIGNVLGRAHGQSSRENEIKSGFFS